MSSITSYTVEEAEVSTQLFDKNNKNIEIIRLTKCSRTIHINQEHLRRGIPQFGCGIFAKRTAVISHGQIPAAVRPMNHHIHRPNGESAAHAVGCFVGGVAGWRGVG